MWKAVETKGLEMRDELQVQKQICYELDHLTAADFQPLSLCPMLSVLPVTFHSISILPLWECMSLCVHL